MPYWQFFHSFLFDVENILLKAPKIYIQKGIADLSAPTGALVVAPLPLFHITSKIVVLESEYLLVFLV